MTASRTVLLTGAAGVLGSAVTALLEQEPGVELRLTDVRDLETPHEFRKVDLANPEAIAGLCDGVDEVMHIAAIHPWRQYTPEQYIDCNIKSTYNLLEEAAARNVDRVIYTSSIASMGMSDGPALPWDESKPCRPNDSIYSVSKHVGEQFCDLFRKKAGLHCVMLRPGTFIPIEVRSTKFGFGLLTCWLHPSDCARAHLLAFRSDVQDDAFVITAGTRFGPADRERLASDAAALIRETYPRVAELEKRGTTLPTRLSLCYSVQHATEELGYEPEFTFERWLDDVLEHGVVAE